MSDFFLYTITILSGLITVITGIVTIIGYFHRKPVSPSQPIIQPTSQHAPPHQVYVPPSQHYAQTPLPHIPTAQQPSKQPNHLSHPRIALIALIGQVLLVAAVVGFSAVSVKSSQLNLINIISFLAFLAGEACAITALVMGLLKTKQLHRWGWFTGLIAGFIGLFIVFLPALIPLLFGIFGPKEQRAANTQAVFP